MGFTQSRFHEALRHGNHEEAHALFSTKKSLRDSLEPNTSLGQSYDDNSVLHYAAHHAMIWLYRKLITRGGKPDLKNGLHQNSLHLVCGASSRPAAREAILKYTMEEGLHGMDVAHVLEEKDEDGNTALHLAACSGLSDCVELLLGYGADPFLTNKKEQTAADCATAAGHSDIATHLETKMVFSTEDQHNPAPPVDPDHTQLMELAEAPTGMRDSDIRSMKDQLLIETSELLGVSLFTAEALLKHHGWSKEQLVEAWMESPADACEKAGVHLPKNLGSHNLDKGGGPQHKLGDGQREERECGVCALPYHKDIEVPCGHSFCQDCWRQYLHMKIEHGEAHTITCPEFGCYKLVPVEVIESIVSREMAQRYLQFDIKAFVDSNPNIRWCPYPNCHRAVRLTTHTDDLSTPGRPPQPTTVQCGNEHYFCWSCAEEPHDPCDCETWKKWQHHIEDMRPQLGDKTSSQLDNAASQKWLARRSKPCPKCKAPIEKTEGCNHMCCRKCKHDFCWVCLDEWKQHNSSTGGYFECNRYDVRRKAETMLQKRTEKVMEGLEEVEKLRRFMHYYERYKTHKDNLALEQPYLQKAHDKMLQLYISVSALDSARRSSPSERLDMSFIEEAVRELLAARRVLLASYAFGYYLEGRSARREFENMQGALEEVTESLAEVVARPHLRKPRTEIIQLTRECREKRVLFVKSCSTLSPPTPPDRRRRSRLFYRHTDESDSSGSASSEGPSEFLRFLNEVRRQHPPAPPQAPQQSDQEELDRALQISREEYEEQKQLQADIELAKELSLQDLQSSQHRPTPDEELQLAEASPYPHTRRQLSPVLQTLIPSQQIPTTHYKPSQTASGSYGALTPLNTCPEPSPLHSWTSPVDQSNSPPSNGSPADEGTEPMWEDEELVRALSLSLHEQQQQQQQEERQQPVENSNREQWLHLPLELRHLLQDSNRSGQSV